MSYVSSLFLLCIYIVCIHLSKVDGQGMEMGPPDWTRGMEMGPPDWNRTEVPPPPTCNTITNKKCIFPFTYKKQIHYECTTVESEAAWCATAVDGNGDVIVGKWADCDYNCPGNAHGRSYVTKRTSFEMEFPEMEPYQPVPGLTVTEVPPPRCHDHRVQRDTGGPGGCTSNLKAPRLCLGSVTFYFEWNSRTFYKTTRLRRHRGAYSYATQITVNGNCCWKIIYYTARPETLNPGQILYPQYAIKGIKKKRCPWIGGMPAIPPPDWLAQLEERMD